MRVTKVQRTLAQTIEGKIQAHQDTILFLSMEIQELKKRMEKISDLNTLPYEEIARHMSVRLANCLQNADLDNTEKLLDYIYSQPQPRSLLCIKNMGRKYLHELANVLNEVLGIDISEEYRA
tara:strand:+ start:442 stop:807 length:366 start_codon:yes stop_codon:yes gene_type:complete